MEFMETLKVLFGEDGNTALTYQQFSEAVKARGYKLADLATGNYVGKKKHEDELSAKDLAINDLKAQIKTRDTDITNLQAQLAGDGDNAAKIEELTNQLTKLQGDYDTAKKDYESKLSAQSYDFAVTEYANSKQFTSNAAKKNFISEMRSEGLKMKNGVIIGADDFMKAWAQDNADAISASPDPEDKGRSEPDNKGGEAPKPNFIQPTAPQVSGTDNPFVEAFHFVGVRPQPTEQ